MGPTQNRSSGELCPPKVRRNEIIIQWIALLHPSRFHRVNFLVNHFQKYPNTRRAFSRPGRRRALTRRFGLALSLAALAIVAGCKVGPDYKRPEATTIPAAYAGVTNAGPTNVGATNGWKVAQPQAQIPKGNWW